jgi:polyhydroxyalkanoate synthesis regulator phasin
MAERRRTTRRTSKSTPRKSSGRSTARKSGSRSTAKKSGSRNTAKKSGSRSTERKSGSRSTSARKPAASGRRRSSARRSTARRSTARSSASTTGLDKSIEQFRAQLEDSLTLTRDRVQEAADDAVRRGRMQRKDAEKLVSDLVRRGRRQSDSLQKDLERLVKQVQREVQGRSAPARRQAGRAAGRAARAARDAADRPLAEADKIRRRAGVGPNFPITAYDQLTAPQVKSRLKDLTPAELRKVRDYEKRTQNRKGVVSAVNSKLS